MSVCVDVTPHVKHCESCCSYFLKHTAGKKKGCVCFDIDTVKCPLGKERDGTRAPWAQSGREVQTRIHERFTAKMITWFCLIWFISYVCINSAVNKACKCLLIQIKFVTVFILWRAFFHMCERVCVCVCLHLCGNEENNNFGDFLKKWNLEILFWGNWSVVQSTVHKVVSNFESCSN